MKNRPLSYRIHEDPVSCKSCSLVNVCLPSGLNQQDLDTVSASVEKARKIKRSEYLFHKGNKQHGIYAIKAGGVKTSISTADGEEQILEFYLPGDLLGFDAWETGNHNCDAVALSDTLICELPSEQMDHLCDKVPSLRQQMMRMVGKELSHSHNLLLSLGQLKTEERLATFLLGLSKRNQQRGFSATEFYLPMARHDLANYLGMAVETISRIFSKLQSDELISVKHRLIKIRDINALSDLAHDIYKIC